MRLYGRLKLSILKTGSVFFLLVLLFQVSQLNAQSQIPDSLVKERIQYIQTTLNEGKPAARLWWNAWLYGYSAGTMVQGGIFLSSTELKTRQDMALGAATSLIAAVGQLVMPMTPAHTPGKLALLPGDTPEERILKLGKAEEYFEASAQRELDGRSWKMHAASGAVNLGSGLITWLGFDRTFAAGFWNFALNSAITEAQIWTQPTRAIRDYRKYCDKYKSGVPQATNTLKTSFFVNAYPGGLRLRLVF